MKASLSKPGAMKFLEESQLRQSDYSKKMNELSEKEKATVGLQNELVKWKTDAEAKLQAASLTARQEAEQRAMLDARLKNVCETYGIDPASIGMTVTPPNPNPNNPNPAPNTNNPQNPEFLTRKEWDEQQKLVARQYPHLPALLYDLGAQHQQLFGKGFSDYEYTPQGGEKLTGTQALVQKALDTGKNLKQVWEEEFKVPERRKQQEEEGVQKRIVEAVQKREAELRSELKLPPPARPGTSSPVLEQFRASNPQTGQPELSGPEAAARAWAEHKYGTGNAA